MGFKALSDSIVGVCQDVFGELYSYTPNGGTPTSIKGIFDHAWVDIEGTASVKPTLRINLADLVSEPTSGDRVTIDTVNYNVMESRPDGFGSSTLILQKV